MLKNYLTILLIQQTQYILLNAFKHITSLICKPQNYSSDNGLTVLLPPSFSKRSSFKYNVTELDIDEWLTIFMGDGCVLM